MNKLKYLREKSGLTQEKVANELSVTQSAISQWENEESHPQTRILCKLAKLYNCTVDDLLRNSDTA